MITPTAGRKTFPFVRASFDTLIVVRVSFEGHRFDVITPGGHYLHVIPPSSLSNPSVSILSLVEGPKELLTEEEMEEYAPDLDRLHLSSERSVERIVYEKKDTLRTNHHVHLRGLLKKKKGEYYLTFGEQSKLVISSKSIEEQQVGVVCLVKE